tara:strand:- start:298 stop:651 length:354 start_codon:yes stop_codon:yes gene_type:complete
MTLSVNQIFLKIYSNFFAKKMGSDEYGNIYYSKSSKSVVNNFRERRWVIYKGEVEASKVPQEWNAWLHHSVNNIPDKRSRKPKWIKKHIVNKPRNINEVILENKYQKKSYEIWKPDD